MMIGTAEVFVGIMVIVLSAPVLAPRMPPAPGLRAWEGVPMQVGGRRNLRSCKIIVKPFSRLKFN